LAIFFSFFDPGIAFDKTGFFQRDSQIRICQYERLGNTVAYRSGLTGIRISPFPGVSHVLAMAFFRFPVA